MNKHVNISTLAQKATLPQTHVQVDPRFIGRLVRDDGWSITNWQIPWHVIYLIHEGNCQFTTRRQTLQASAGQAVLFDPRRVGRVRFSPVMRYSELRFEMSSTDSCWTMRKPVCILNQAFSLAGYIDQLAREVRMNTGKTTDVIRHWLGLILAYAHRLNQQDGKASNNLTAAQLDALIHHVQEHLGQSITVSDLADVLHLSPDYFSRVFKRTIGESPRAWLVRERIRHACHLLQYSVDNVDLIALQIGYSNTTHFCRQFRQCMGTTPAAWREKVG